MQGITVTIIDWAKFNPRADRANYSWFRFENTFFTKTFSWGSERQRLFLYLLTCASQVNRAEFTLDIELAFTLLKRKLPQILSDLKYLAVVGVIVTAESRLNDGVLPSLLPATYVRTNVTNVTNERICPVFDFEKVFEKYPKRLNQNKDRAFKTLLATVSTEAEFDLCVKAAMHYQKYVTHQKIEQQFIKQFSTWASQWREWVDEPEFQNSQWLTEMMTISKEEEDPFEIP